MTQTLIAGEAIDDITRALLKFEITPCGDGMSHVKANFEPSVAVPFRRALLRIESELMRLDADELTPDRPVEHRTDDQRRADALNELIRRFADAVGVPTTALRTD